MLQLFRDSVIDIADLGFEQTVPRSLVHKRALENVLLTDLRACSEEWFVCAGHAPTAHGFFNTAGRTPHTDILFYTELGRQASLAISHSFLGVGSDEVFIFEQSEAELTDAAWTPASAAAPVVVDVRLREVTRRRNNAVNRVVATYGMSIGGLEVFRGTGAWTVQPAALFRRLRRGSGARPSSADGAGTPCGRGFAGGAVIDAPRYVDKTRTFVTSLIVDGTHPYFFDHPCDHVPGMLLLEACAQLALAACGGASPSGRHAGAVRAYDVNFSQFVECGIPTTLTGLVTDDRTVNIVISQQDLVSGTTRMIVAFPA